MRIRPLASLLLVAVVASCKDAAPPVPASLDAVTGPAATIVVATTLATPPTFEVRTAGGKAIKNVPFAVAVTQGGGSVTNSPTVTVAGPTSIGIWTLGTTAGAQTVTVTVADLPVLAFQTIATPGAPAALEMVAGDDQRTGENTQIPLPIQVRVKDVHNNPILGVTVNWAVTGGGGGVAAASSITNASGIATSPAWTLGLEAAGAQLLTATLGAFAQIFSAVVQEPAASITVETTAPATVGAGMLVTVAPTFVVRDAGGNALNGVPVTITVTAGGGSLANAALQSGPTPTPIGNWTVGTGIGTQSVTVQVTGVPNAVISTTTVAGPPSVMDIVEGDDQEALAGAAVADPIRVRVEDSFGNTIGGDNVLWTVIEGNGSVSAGSSVANGSGVATAPAWTLGRVFGAQTLRAQQASAVADLSATIQSGYALNVVYFPATPAQSVQDAFNSAVNRIKALVVGELSLIAFPLNFAVSPFCVAGLVINGDTIPGLRIYARIEAIDGLGGVLGSARPCYTRGLNGPTIVGMMRFDSADLDNMVANGSIESVILHEILHVIGVGTLWGVQGQGLRPDLAPNFTPIFLGALAKDACINDHAGVNFCTAGVPAEDCLNLSQSCGVFTINSHWKESVFRTELMTGFLNAGLNPFSKMTIRSLADLGYTVNTIPNDPYTVPPPALMSSIPAWSLRMGEPQGPIASLDDNGRIVYVYPRPDDR